MKSYTISWGSRTLVLGPRTCVMGILNVTPDSFSDGGRFFTLDGAEAQAERLIAEGADILDIGGESTRPYAEEVSTEEEIRRVVPVIERIAGRFDVPISIDTTKAEVARAALKAGAGIINDISAFSFDPDLAGVAAETGVPVILMHMKGTPRTMQVDPVYTDVVGEIADFLADAADRAVAAGIDRSRVILDPGIGFGKTRAHNLEIFRRLTEFAALDAPILMGPSRKTFIRLTLKENGIEPTPEAIENGTQAAVAVSILNGAHIVRVHDVARAVATARILDPIRTP